MKASCGTVAGGDPFPRAGCQATTPPPVPQLPINLLSNANPSALPAIRTWVCVVHVGQVVQQHQRRVPYYGAGLILGGGGANSGQGRGAGPRGRDGKWCRSRSSRADMGGGP